MFYYKFNFLEFDLQYRRKRSVFILESHLFRLGWLRFPHLNQLGILTPQTVLAVINWSGYDSLAIVLAHEDNWFNLQPSTHVLGCCNRMIFVVVRWNQIIGFCDFWDLPGVAVSQRSRLCHYRKLIKISINIHVSNCLYCFWKILFNVKNCKMSILTTYISNLKQHMQLKLSISRREKMDLKLAEILNLG